MVSELEQMLSVENMRGLVVDKTADTENGSVKFGTVAGQMVGRFKTAAAKHGGSFYHMILCRLSWYDGALISNLDFPLFVPGVWPIANREPLISTVIEKVAVDV